MGRGPNLRAALPVLVVLLVAGALSAAVASAVRSSRASTGVVVVVPATPGASATAPVPTAPPGFGRDPSGATGGAGATGATGATGPVAAPVPALRSVAVGRPNAGRLLNGVLLPAEGPNHTSWDLIEHRHPDRDWRRVGTDKLVATILSVAASYRRAHPGAPRVVVSDLSLPQGGPFGREYGGLGHASHQNGLDVDVDYPRKDGQEIGTPRVADIDHALAQALVTAFVKAGAQYVFVGPHTGLRGPRGVVQPLANHDDHLHVRIYPRR